MHTLEHYVTRQFTKVNKAQITQSCAQDNCFEMYREKQMILK